jgi:hypothetical protein
MKLNLSKALAGREHLTKFEVPLRIKLFGITIFLLVVSRCYRSPSQSDLSADHVKI